MWILGTGSKYSSPIPNEHLWRLSSQYQSSHPGWHALLTKQAKRGYSWLLHLRGITYLSDGVMVGPSPVHLENYPVTIGERVLETPYFGVDKSVFLLLDFSTTWNYKVLNTVRQRRPIVCAQVLTSGFWLSFLKSPFRTWSVAGTSRAQWGRAPAQQTQRQRNQQLHSADHWKDTSTGDRLPAPFFIHSALTVLKLSSARAERA